MSRARTLSRLLGNSGSLEVTPTAVSDQSNTSSSYFDVPSGTTAQRPVPPNTGMLRYNTDYGCLEQYTVSGWSTIITDLYDFSSVTFSEGTNYGRTGTDQSTWVNRVNQSWASVSTNFSVTGGVLYWTVPANGNYKITAAGAGGAPNPGSTAQATSKGAIMRGIINLSRGTQLMILVGKRGDPLDNASAYYSLGAGGGGTFVAYASNNNPIIVAGGGGGCFNGATTLADIYYFGQTRNVPALGFTTTPPDSLTSGYGAYGFDAGGGGGYYGDGVASAAGGSSVSNTTGYSTPYGCQGRAFIRASDRGIGGASSTTAYSTDAEGGFGGGGGGHTGSNAAGGGGGYTGGPGGYSGWNVVHGHGGGSFLHASMTNSASSDGQYNGSQVFNGYTLTNIGYNTLNYAGYVTIERV